MDGSSATAAVVASGTDAASDEAAKLVKEIGIPPCPAILVEFMAESNKNEPDFRRLSHLINKDAGLAASVLKTINSPFYGLARKARTVNDALTLLGLRNTTRLIAGLLLMSAFPSSRSPAMYSYWDSTARIALITGFLARELGVSSLDEAHTFALFRDCGVPVLLTRFPDYEQLLTSTAARSELGRSDIERTRYQLDHAHVGAALARTWHLPVETCHAIRVHNAFDGAAFESQPDYAHATPLIALALLAEQLYRINRGVFDPDAWNTEDALVARALGSMQDRLEPLANDIERLLHQS